MLKKLSKYMKGLWGLAAISAAGMIVEAICELALPEDDPCPIILDDALVNFDPCAPAPPCACCGRSRGRSCCSPASTGNSSCWRTGRRSPR